MPCDSVRQTSVDLSAVGKIDLTLLTAAFNALGLRAALSADKSTITLAGGRYDAKTGQLVINSYSRVTVEDVKKAYGAEVVKATAKRFGWTLKQTAPFEYVVNKR